MTICYQEQDGSILLLVANGHLCLLVSFTRDGNTGCGITLANILFVLKSPLAGLNALISK
jgi:hypothetical protein